LCGQMEKARDFDLPDHEGRRWNLSDHLVAGALVVVFYRGDW